MPVSNFSIQDCVSNGISIGHTGDEVHSLAPSDTSLIGRLQFLLPVLQRSIGLRWSRFVQSSCHPCSKTILELNLTEDMTLVLIEHLDTSWT